MPPQGRTSLAAPGMLPLRTRSVSEFMAAFRRRLRDRRFWLVQAMVVAVTVSHTLVELFSLLPAGLAAVYFLPASLYFFPVLYASLNFGREGAVPTAVWSAVLAVPNILLWHSGAEGAGESFQLATVILFAAVVAGRVDKEIVARRQAEEQGRASHLSELKYRGLFERVGQAIVVFDAAGVVREANEAAAVLFGRARPAMEGAHLRELVGEDGVKAVLAPPAGEHSSRLAFAIPTADGEVWLEPVCTVLPGSEGALILGLFRDVTAQRGFQSYAREIVRAQEEERQRIARELHDVSLQSVVLLCRRLDAVEEAAVDGLPADVAATLTGARTLAEAIGAELRRFSRDLRPSVLDDLGLVPAIRSLLADLGERSGIRGSFALTGQPCRLPATVEVSLFRIAQESLRNVEKHANASHVSVRLAFDRETVGLEVADDGRGFQMPQSTTHLAAAGRLGLLGMQERASLTGGACEVDTRPGQGTRVSVELPIWSGDERAPPDG